MSCMPAAFEGLVVHDPVSSCTRKSSIDAQRSTGTPVSCVRCHAIVARPSPGPADQPLVALMVRRVAASHVSTRRRDRLSIQVSAVGPAPPVTGTTEPLCAATQRPEITAPDPTRSSPPRQAETKAAQMSPVRWMLAPRSGSWVGIGSDAADPTTAPSRSTTTALTEVVPASTPRTNSAVSPIPVNRRGSTRRRRRRPTRGRAPRWPGSSRSGRRTGTRCGRSPPPWPPPPAPRGCW